MFLFSFVCFVLLKIRRQKIAQIFQTDRQNLPRRKARRRQMSTNKKTAQSDRPTLHTDCPLLHRFPTPEQMHHDQIDRTVAFLESDSTEYASFISLNFVFASGFCFGPMPLERKFPIGTFSAHPQLRTLKHPVLHKNLFSPYV